MADTIIISPTTASSAASAATEFTIGQGDPAVTVYIYGGTYTATEYITLQRKVADGAYEDVVDHSFNGSGGTVQLDGTTATDIVVVGHGTFAVKKGTTSAAVGVALADRNF